MIVGLGRLAVSRPRRVLIVAGVVFVVAAAFGLPATGALSSRTEDFQDPGSQFEQTSAAISAATGQMPCCNVTAVLRSGGDPGPNPAGWQAAESVASLLSHQPGFQHVVDYPATQSPTLLSRDGRETVVLAAFASTEDGAKAARRVRATLAKPPGAARLEGASVRFGGLALITEELNERTISGLERAELIALPIVLLLSFWFFRGLVAALLPLLVGGFSILLTFLVLRLVNQITPVSIFALNLASGMGLGLGIDYSLFIVYRYREELAGGLAAGEAIVSTLRTAGRTVLFSSVTVAAALTCLLVFPIRFLYSMGIGGAVVALCDGAVALVVLPALLVALGSCIDALSPAWLERRGARSVRVARDGWWWKLAHAVMRRPATVAVLSAAALLAAALPARNLQLTSPGANLLPASAESHQVEAALARDFPANPAEATEIVVKGPRSAAVRLAAAATAAAGALAKVSPPRPLVHGRRHQAPVRSSPAGETWAIAMLPRGSPYSAAQERLLHGLRTLAEPYRALVGGATAYFVDQKASIASHIVPAVAILAALTVIFLFAMTGSVTIPVKAVVMSLLSISVSAGLLVLIFQDGHLSGPLGFTPIGGLEESTLVLMFVIAFALSTDYEVFVLARIKEAYDEGLPNREAIALGIERTGRIITAAALLFCVAIGALATSELFFTKQLGIGTALAVAIDAAVVRALLVPALMALMGRWNWWAPGPLRRLHERFGPREDSARRPATTVPP